MSTPEIGHEEYQFRKEVLERMTRLETILAPLANGRVKAIEQDVKTIEGDVSKIKEGRAWDRGLVAGISLAVSAAFAAIRVYLRVP